MSPDHADACAIGARAATLAGWMVLAAGGSAIDAVCAAVTVLEDDVHFNAGIGSCLTSAGTVEMDASIMDGATLAAGAVALIRTLPNPIQAARAIVAEGKYVFLAGPDAEGFATAHGLMSCENSALITPDQREHARKHLSSPATVGAVAVDRDGHVAAATSTGGIMGKPPGRIGDSAIIGAGTFADDTLGAASATGEGEAIMRVGLCRMAVDLLRDGFDPQQAARQSILRLHGRVGGHGGIIVVDPLGRIGYAYNTSHMTYAYMHPGLVEPLAFS